MIVHTRQALGASWIWVKHSCPQASLSGQREHSLNFNCSFPIVASKAAFPAATRTAAGRCVSGHETSLFPRNFRYVRRARQSATTARTITAIASIKRMYFMGRSIGRHLQTTKAQACISATSATHENPIASERSFRNSVLEVLSLGRFHVVINTSVDLRLAVTGLT